MHNFRSAPRGGGPPGGALHPGEEMGRSRAHSTGRLGSEERSWDGSDGGGDGGRRASSSPRILASYTPLSSAGDLEDMSMKLIRAVSPPPISPMTMDAQTPSSKPQLSRHVCGTYYFNQLVAQGRHGRLVFLCVSCDANDSLFDFLLALHSSVMAALDSLPMPMCEDSGSHVSARRAASLALVETLNRTGNLESDSSGRDQETNCELLSPDRLHMASAHTNALHPQRSKRDGGQRARQADAVEGPFGAAPLVSSPHNGLPQPSMRSPCRGGGKSTQVTDLTPDLPPFAVRRPRSLPLRKTAPPSVAAPHPTLSDSYFGGRAGQVSPRAPQPRMELNHQRSRPNLPLSPAACRSNYSGNPGEHGQESGPRSHSPKGEPVAAALTWQRGGRELQRSKGSVVVGEPPPASRESFAKSEGHHHSRANSEPEQHAGGDKSLRHTVRGSKSGNTLDLLGESLDTKPIRRTTVAEERLWRRRAELWQDGDAAGPDLSHIVTTSPIWLASPLGSPEALDLRRMTAIEISRMNLQGVSSALDDALIKSEGESKDDEGTGSTVGLLLPLDYSGMEDIVSPVTNDFERELQNALECQVALSTTLDDILTVMVKNRDKLSSIPLPRPAAVDFEQALKDAKRESITVNGLLFRGEVDALLERLKEIISPLVFNDGLVDQVCRDIVRASSRTASGGDTYSAVVSLLCPPGSHFLLVPSSVESSPISVTVDGTKGEVSILVDNHFDIKVMPDEQEDQGGESKRISRRSLKSSWRDGLNNLMGGKNSSGKLSGASSDKNLSPDRRLPQNENSDDTNSVQVSGRLEVFLSLLNGSCSRQLCISSPSIENVPPQYIALGAGSPEVNGTFDIMGWESGAPLYINSRSQSTIRKTVVSDRSVWIVGFSVTRAFYIADGSLSPLVPPDTYWSVAPGMPGALDPPPTLMMSYRKANAKNKS